MDYKNAVYEIKNELKLRVKKRNQLFAVSFYKPLNRT